MMNFQNAKTLLRVDDEAADAEVKPVTAPIPSEFCAETTPILPIIEREGPFNEKQNIHQA